MESAANKDNVRGSVLVAALVVGFLEIAVAMGAGLALANFLVLWYMT